MNDSKTAERSLVVSGSLQRHQVEKYLKLSGVEWWSWLHEDPRENTATFHIRATDEQWDQIQAWVKKVTG